MLGGVTAPGASVGWALNSMGTFGGGGDGCGGGDRCGGGDGCGGGGDGRSSSWISKPLTNMLPKPFCSMIAARRLVAVTGGACGGDGGGQIGMLVPLPQGGGGGDAGGEGPEPSRIDFKRFAFTTTSTPSAAGTMVILVRTMIEPRRSSRTSIETPSPRTSWRASV